MACRAGCRCQGGDRALVCGHVLGAGWKMVHFLVVVLKILAWFILGGGSTVARRGVSACFGQAWESPETGAPRCPEALAEVRCM